MDTKITGDVVLVRWLDNGVVNIASTEVSVVKRWSEAAKGKIEVLCPESINFAIQLIHGQS